MANATIYRLPARIAQRLLDGERVLFYGEGGGGCLSGPRLWFLVTDARVSGLAVEPGGCLAATKYHDVDIPLRQISSVHVDGQRRTSGIVTASGTAKTEFALKLTNAQETARIVQMAIRNSGLEHQ